MTEILALLVLGAIVVGVVALVRRGSGREARPSEGADLIPYGLLALSMGTAAFALAQLGRAAFPGAAVVLDTERQVATALSALIVATPFVVVLWRRQANRRAAHPRSPGWTVYLAAVEAVFMTALVVSAFQVLDWLLAEGAVPSWTNVVVFGAVVAFHEMAAHRTPPASDAADLPRVVGSAIGLIPAAIGLAGILFWILDRIYSSLAPTAGGPVVGTWIALLLVGAPLWGYRWLRRWPSEAGVPRNAWTVITAVAGLATAIGAAVALFVSFLTFLVTPPVSAGAHFDAVPVELSVLTVGILILAHHRRRLGMERSDPVRAYEYAMAALGLSSSIGGASTLTVMALGGRELVRPSTDDVIVAATILAAGLVVWLWFWSKDSRAPSVVEAATWPRKLYLLGLGIITGLVSAGALIATLFVLLQRLLTATVDGESLVVQASLFVYSGLATWHLLRTYFQDRALFASEEVIAPFDVTIVCSHPGMIATRFPKEARMKVVYRGDDSGRIDDETAAAIVEAVGHRSSLVWVDETGFRVAPSR